MRDHPLPVDRQRRPPYAERQGAVAVVNIASFAIIVAGLYFARDVLIPIALAVLLSFVLSPLVNYLRRNGGGRVLSVMAAVLVALLLVLGIAGLIGGQIAGLAEQAGRYEATIQQKIETIRDATLGRLLAITSHLGQQLAPAPAPAPKEEPQPSGDSAQGQGAGAPTPAPKPVPVEVHQPEHSALELAQRIVSPVVSPLTTLLVTFIFAIFILLQREDLRDRLIRLFGSTDLHRMTFAMDDAAERLSGYFLALLGINAAFGAVIALGLAFIGVPSPILWGVVGMLLRFVPYVGATLSAAPPLALAAAIDPGWAPLLWTIALFASVEIVLSQVVEPLLYGHTTGLSPVSVVIAATFWTWLWGPIGLILSTPITLCLVVLGRHVDRLSFIDIALGDRPALTPVESFYQRMLAGAPHEAQDQAKELLKEQSLSAYYDEVVIEGMRLAESDLSRGVLDREHFDRIRKALDILIAELDAYDDVDPPPAGKEGATERRAAKRAARERPAVEAADESADDRPVVLCVAGRGFLDRTVAAISSQLLAKHGLKTRLAPYTSTSRSMVETLDVQGVSAICVMFLTVRDKPRYMRKMLLRLRQQAPAIPLIVGLWAEKSSVFEEDVLRVAIGADHLVGSLRDLARVCSELSSRATWVDTQALEHRPPLPATVPSPEGAAAG